MEHDQINCATATCPCGRNQVAVDVVTADNGWSIKTDWVGRIECDHCRDLYTFIPDGRGVALIGREEAAHREKLKRAAHAHAQSYLGGEEVSRVLDHVAARLQALPTVAARYRLAVELGLESATLATFRKHVRDVPMRQWLTWRIPADSDHYERSLSALAPLYALAEVDPARLRECSIETNRLRDQAREQPNIIMRLGPINLFAAISQN